MKALIKKSKVSSWQKHSNSFTTEEDKGGNDIEVPAVSSNKKKADAV